MRVKYPAMQCELETHTVDTPRGRLAGFLVRCSSSRKELGYVWSAGASWRWQTPAGDHSGERSSQQAAVRVLRDAYDLSRQPSFLDAAKDRIDEIKTAWRAPIILPPMKPKRRDEGGPTWTSRSPNTTGDSTASSKRSAPASSPEPKRATPSENSPISASTTPPVKKIDWSKHTAGDATAAFEAALRHTKK